MVKPLNKEWALFGRKYRVAGAKGEKVDCNACQKQVSAAVNRLQSHLRVCPARPATVAETTVSDSITTKTVDVASGDAALTEQLVADAATASGSDALAVVGSKRPRGVTTLHAAPSLQRLRVTSDGEYTTRRLEIEEQRLQLELARARREQTREALELEMLEAKTRKAKHAAEKEAYEARVLLALSRKQLRDQGVDEHEIDRVLPIEPLGVTSAVEETEEAAVEDVADAEEDHRREQDDVGGDDANGHVEAAAANAAAMEAAGVASSKLSDEAVL